jgi:hypothetical protein
MGADIPEKGSEEARGGGGEAMPALAPGGGGVEPRGAEVPAMKGVGLVPAAGGGGAAPPIIGDDAPEGGGGIELAPGELAPGGGLPHGEVDSNGSGSAAAPGGGGMAAAGSASRVGAALGAPESKGFTF